MPTVTLLPNGDGVNSGVVEENGHSSPLYDSVDDGTDPTPGTSTYNNFSAGDYCYYDFENTPSDLVTADSVSVKFHASVVYDKNPNADQFDIQIISASYGTAVTNQQTIQIVGTMRQYYSVSLTVLVDDKTTWDGARVRFRCNSGSDDGLLLYAWDMDLTYTAGVKPFAGRGLFLNNKRPDDPRAAIVW